MKKSIAISLGLYAMIGLVSWAIMGCTSIPNELYDLIPERPATTTTTTTIPPPPVVVDVPPVVEEEEKSDTTPNAPELHPPVYSMDGATVINRESGQVNNPANSRGRLKFIVSPKRSGTIVRVYCFKDGFTDNLKRAYPNEGGNRQRYYGKHAPASYPKDLYIRIDCNVDGVAKDVIYILKDPTKREG